MRRLTPQRVGAPPSLNGAPTPVPRRLHAGVAAAAVLALAVLTVLVVSGATDAADTALLGRLHATPGSTTETLALAATTLGDGWPLIGAVTAAGLLVRRLTSSAWRTVLLPLVALAVASATGSLLKLALERPRPRSDGWLGSAAGYAFPSGHTTAATAGYLGLALVAAGLVASRRSRLLICLSGAAVAVLVGWSRLALGVHWPSDVLGGWLLGTTAAAAVIALLGGRTGSRCPAPASAPASTPPPPTSMSS